ncbi:hypothetical protein EBZ37_11230 [bacterium]|nr:hypothetical protein [bacterium]
MSKQDIVMQIPCNPEIFGTTTFPVTMYKKTLKIRPKSKPFKAMTLGEEIDALVKEWYAERGLPVPAGELIGAQIADSVDAEQKKELEAEKAKKKAEREAAKAAKEAAKQAKEAAKKAKA